MKFKPGDLVKCKFGNRGPNREAFAAKVMQSRISGTFHYVIKGSATRIEYMCWESELEFIKVERYE